GAHDVPGKSPPTELKSDPYPNRSLMTIVICKAARNTLCSMVSLDDTDCKSDAARNKQRTISDKAASNREIGSLENAESHRSPNLRRSVGLAARARFRRDGGAGHERARVPQKIQRIGGDSEDGRWGED